MSKFVETEHISTREILKFPDHYVAMPVMVKKTTEPGIKEIIPKGTLVGGKDNPVITDVRQPVVDKFKVAGTPEQAVAASLITGKSTDNNRLKFIAAVAGAAGNKISVEIVDPREDTASGPVVVTTEDLGAGKTNILITLKNTAGEPAKGTTGGEAAADNVITWTSKLPGSDGDDIVIVLQDPVAIEANLDVKVVGHTVIISLPTVAVTGNIEITAEDLVIALGQGTGEEFDALNELVTYAFEDTGQAAVVDETIVLNPGNDGDYAGDVADVIDAFGTASITIATIAAVESDSGAVEPAPRTNLEGGVDAGSVAQTSADGTEGVLMNDVDVTYGDAPGAMIIHGFIAIDKMPYDSDNDEAVAAAGLVLPGVKFIR